MSYDKKTNNFKLQSPSFEPTFPQRSPLLEDVVATGREFANKIANSIQGSGIFSSMGVKPNKSFILQGKPGTGKTFALWGINNYYNQAIFEEVQYHREDESDSEIVINEKDFGLFLFEYNVGEHGTAYINRGAKIIQKFFNNGFIHSHAAPTILMFDEADAILISRKKSRNHHREDNKNLETVMKNLQWAKNIDNLFVVFLTNYPEALDEAMVRSGRVDEIIKFKEPDFNARRDLFKSSINMLNRKSGYKVVRNYNLDELARISKGLVNSDIDEAVKRAVRLRAIQLVRVRTHNIIPAGYVTQKRIIAQIEKIQGEEESLEKYIL